MLQLKGLIGIKTHPIGVEDLVVDLEEYEDSDTLTTITVSKTHKKKSTIGLTIIINALCHPKGPFFTGSWSCLKSSARKLQRIISWPNS